MVDLSYFGYDRDRLPDALHNRLDLLDTPQLPFDGMNEAGLAIGMSAVPLATAPQVLGQTTVGDIEIIRLALDRAADVEEAIELFGSYNIFIHDPPIHYLLADSSGHAAVIEFVDGTMSVLRNTEPWQVSTNFVITGSPAPLRTGCWRYDRVWSTLSTAEGGLEAGSAMQLLEDVSQSHTIWSTVYLLGPGEIRVAAGRWYDTVESFSLAGFSR
jgi:hypothetical protein